MKLPKILVLCALEVAACSSPSNFSSTSSEFDVTPVDAPALTGKIVKSIVSDATERSRPGRSVAEVAILQGMINEQLRSREAAITIFCARPAHSADARMLCRLEGIRLKTQRFSMSEPK